MRCGCVPRLFRRATRTCPLISTVDAFLPRTESEKALPSPSSASQTSLPHTDDTKAEVPATPKSDVEKAAAAEEPLEEEQQEAGQSTGDMTDGSVRDGTVVEEEGEGKEDKVTGLPTSVVAAETSDKTRRSAAPFFRNFFKRPASVDDLPSIWIRCDLDVTTLDGRETVRLTLRFDDDHGAGNSHRLTKIASMPTSATIQSFFRIRGRKNRDETEMHDLIRAHHPSGTSAAKSENSEEEEQSNEVSSRPKEQRSMFCFGWGQALGASNEDDEAITLTEGGSMMSEAPPGLVGLLNLGNTCFLNAALQCLRCTPGFVTLVVPDLKEGFEGGSVMSHKEGVYELGKENQAPPVTSIFNVGGAAVGGGRLQNRSHTSSSFLCPRSAIDTEWECVLTLRSSSLPMPLPHEIAGRLQGETGLAGGAVLRLSSVPNLARPPEVSTAVTTGEDAAPTTTPATSNKAVEQQQEQQEQQSTGDIVSHAIDGDDEKNWEVVDRNDDDDDGNGVHEEEEIAMTAAARRSPECNRDPPPHELPVEKETDGDQERRKSPRESMEASNDSQHDHHSATTTISQEEEEEKSMTANTSTTTDKIRRSDGVEPSTSSSAQTDAAEKTVAETEATELSEIELSENFIMAFQKLVMEVCLGDPEKHRSPRDLYLQLKKLPQGEWFCDGGQHDCQEIFRVLLDAIHANYTTVQCIPRSEGLCLGRCLSDVSEERREELDEIEVENLKANSMWRSYLLKDSSPVTEIFAGQLQIVRTCQKCQSRSTTYEPFWDLSLSLSKEKSSWFNPNRVPSSLDDLLRAFTAAEVLEGDDAPYCDSCEQKSPATRRILIHRFPKVLVINIKRFKYTKDGREKLTSNVAFPIHSLRLQNFASKEHQHEDVEEIYDLYAVSNHYGTLGGGHYTASCKVRDVCGTSGWYSFNDKKVTKLNRDSIATPNAYILFYAKQQQQQQPHHND